MPVNASMTHFAHKESLRGLNNLKKLLVFLRHLLRSQDGQEHFFS